jgi:DNA modification methylase
MSLVPVVKPPPAALSLVDAEQMLEGAKNALATLQRVDAVKDIRDKAQALRAYLKQQKGGQRAQNAAASVKIRAERRMGQLLKETPKNEGAKGQLAGRDSSGGPIMGPPEENTPTLAEQGITKNLSSRCQKIADIPDDVFENFVGSTEQSEESELTTAAVLKIAKQRELETIRDSYVKLAKTGEGRAAVFNEDACTFLERIEARSIDLLITDPPYMTDLEDVHGFAHAWLPVALSKIKPTGRAYVCAGAYPDELLAYLSVPRAGLELAQVLVWTYRNTLGPSPSHDYKLNWQAIFYFRGPEAPPLDCPVMNEQFSVQDISAPDGRQANRFHEWQKPDALAERLIRHSCPPGGLVIDPFAGTGTFLAAAARLGRAAMGCDTSAAQVALCEKRGVIRG